jgi:hypothetical protein
VSGCNAPRRPVFVGACRCGHAICEEREQLHAVATLDPHMPVRLVATIFLGALEAMDAGTYGGVAAVQLFD